MFWWQKNILLFLPQRIGFTGLCKEILVVILICLQSYPYVTWPVCKLMITLDLQDVGKGSLCEQPACQLRLAPICFRMKKSSGEVELDLAILRNCPWTRQADMYSCYVHILLKLHTRLRTWSYTALTFSAYTKMKYCFALICIPKWAMLICFPSKWAT